MNEVKHVFFQCVFHLFMDAEPKGYRGPIGKKPEPLRGSQAQPFSGAQQTCKC